MSDSRHDGKKGIGRRQFVAAAAAAGAAAAATPVLRAQQVVDSSSAVLSRRVAPFALDEITLSELREGLLRKRFTARSIVEGYLARIAAIDRAGPLLNSVLELNPDALALAGDLDAELASQGPRGPLHGIPILLKDNFGTGDKMHTSAGSLALAESIAPDDAHVVTRLRDAGCIILGKTNMSEWSNARGRDSVSGWSGRGRLTRNPYALDRSSGGSSSGTAVAVAANLAAAAVGTETMGSIMNPSSVCGIVGMKPTVGLLSRAGIVPVSYNQDSPGPMCRTVRDVAILLSVMAGEDPADPATRGVAARVHADYTQFLDPAGLRGARVGVVRNLFGKSYLADRVIERCLESMRAAGAVLVDPVEIATIDAVWPFDATVLAYELKASLNDYLAMLGPSAKVKSLEDIIAFNERHSDREMRWFGQETFLYAQSKGPLTSPEYLSNLAMVRTLAREQGIDATMKAHSLDVMVAPTQSPAWLIDMLLGDSSSIGAFLVSCAAGYPTISVPAGDVAGLPVGMLFMGTAWSEPSLLKYAYAFEQLVQARRSPSFLPTIETRP